MVVLQLKNSSLIFLGQLCDDDYSVLLSKKNLKVIKINGIVLEGKRNHIDGLWDMTIHLQQNHTFIMPKTHPGLYKHIHNKSCVISSNIPKTLHINKSKSEKGNLKINEKLFQNEIEKTKQHNEIVNVIIRKKQTCVDLAKYLHSTCLSPPVSTLTKEINNNHFNT